MVKANNTIANIHILQVKSIVITARILKFKFPKNKSIEPLNYGFICANVGGKTYLPKPVYTGGRFNL